MARNLQQFRRRSKVFDVSDRGTQAMSNLPNDKFRQLFEDFDTAMLVTRTPTGELRSRPMAIADIESNGTMWFLTQSDAGKLDEISQDNRVSVAMQSKLKFVSISGTATAVDDRAKVNELWNESWRLWFPKGKDDPTLTLLRVHGEKGEYWDNSGARGIQYLIEAGKAYLTGTRPDVEGDPQIHGKVNLETT
jgi:general stress protein 26